MGRSELPAGTVTFLFTDVEGSTRLLHDLGAEGYAEALAEHRRVIREACAAHGGVEVDTQGDAFFFAFPTAPGALEAARALTERLAAGPIRVRVGVHTGTPLLTADGYVGDDVHRAARIAAAGHGGQTLVSASTASLVDGGLRDLGEQRFKDLAAAERVYQLGDVDFPPLKSLYGTNLPVPANRLVGRKKELVDVLRLLTRDAARCVTIVGPGGIGKTRFALAVGAEAAERFPDGVWFVDLTPLRDPTLVLPSIAHAVGVQTELSRHFADTSALLLLDNFEQVVDAAGDVASLLATCPRLAVLVTSREPLRIAAEREYPLRPLPDSPAVELFRQRARAVEPDLEVDQETASAICGKLDRLPLAIELAAARVKVLPPPALLERLEQRLPLLVSRARDVPDRQRTLHSTIAWSYELLSVEEQQLFRRLAVFAGGARLESIAAVAAGDAGVVEALVDKSLLRRRGDRFVMLETIREFAEEGLEDGDLRRRHAGYYSALAARAAPELRAGEQAKWLARLDAERENLRVALAFLRDSGARDEMLELTASLYRFWFYRGHLREGREWLAAALEIGDDELSPVRARALAAAAQLAYRQGAHVEARKLNDRALTAYRALDDPVGVGRVLNQLADVAEAEGDLATAEALWTASVEMARQTGSRYELGVATTNLGSLMLTLGDYDRAIELTSEGLTIFRELEHVNGIAVALENLGCAAIWQGRLADAADLLKEGLVRFRELGMPVYVAHALAELAVVAAHNGEIATAGRLLGATDRILEETGGEFAPDTRALLQHGLAAIRHGADESQFATARQEGTRTTVDEIVDYALAATYA